MKKKSIFLLVASGVGLGLVGSTFAAWAITDNANPFSIQVSTGSIETDTTTKYVTLSYGESQNIGNVGELEAGTYRKAGVLDLRVTTSDASAINGQLEFKVTDSKGEGLASFLKVDVYKGDLDASNGLIAAATLTDKASDKLTFTKENDTYKSAAINTTSGAKHLFTVVIYLKEDIKAAELESLQGKVANIQFDWNHAIPSQDIATTKSLYATGFSGDTYLYAFKGTKANAEWPGVKMEALGDGYHVAEVSSEFEYVVFNNGKSGEQEVKSVDIKISEAFTGELNCYVHGAAQADQFKKYEPAKEPEYYIVGAEFGNWVVGQGAIKLTAGQDGKYTAEIETKVTNSEFKVYDNANDIWYGENGSNNSEPNFKIGDKGTYIITFNPAASGQEKFIVCAQKPQA